MKEYKLNELKLEVIYKCPLVCIHCSSESTPAALPKIELTKCLSILSEAAEMGVRKVAFSGGEPLLYEDLFTITKSAVDFGMQTTIYTTGNVPAVKEIFLKLKSIGLHSLAFSLFASNAKEHELITRRTGSFENTINAIKYAVSIGIESEIHFVALKRNYRLLKDIVRLAKSLNVGKVSILRFVPQGRGQLINNQVLNKHEFIELKNEIDRIRKENFELRTGSPLNFLFVNESPKCYSGINRLLIDADLNISPCDAFKQISSKEIVGSSEFSNLKDISLKESWSKSPYLNAIRNYLESDFNEPCLSCNDLRRCNSGCLAQKVIENGNLSKSPDPSCINN
jgi:radical SAM protein with 4Fe4S-binding SPASM domain